MKDPTLDEILKVKAAFVINKLKTEEDKIKLVEKMRGQFKTELEACLNSNGIDSQLNLSDSILADYIIFALMNLEKTFLHKEMNLLHKSGENLKVKK